jgi:3-dehydroquinate synthase
LERKSFIVALGGGVVGDLAGFVAATYLRGIPFVQVPTTLLAQVDSSVGGKTGVNLKAGKNLVGAFHQPKLVLCDLEALATLPAREFRAGLAEIIKYGIIYDAALFARLERDLPKLLRARIQDAGRSHRPLLRDQGGRRGPGRNRERPARHPEFRSHHRPRLEAISSYGKYLHGEAISIGQVAAAKLSAALTGFPPPTPRVCTLFQRAGLPTQVKLKHPPAPETFAAMKLDKKVSNGEIKFVLARRIGQVVWGNACPCRRLRKF